MRDILRDLHGSQGSRKVKGQLYVTYVRSGQHGQTLTGSMLKPTIFLAQTTQNLWEVDQESMDMLSYFFGEF